MDEFFHLASSSHTFRLSIKAASPGLSRFSLFFRTVCHVFLKTVSAFANYGTGKILFGVNDEGETVGLSDLNDACLSIENKINDSITPRPEFSLEPNSKTGIVTLTVSEGPHKPYLYKSKAYKRSDSATIEVDELEFRRLALLGRNTTFDATEAPDQSLSFNRLASAIASTLGVKSLSKDTLKTLELISANGKYNVAAELLADRNSFPGIDVARFGESINIFLDRETYEKESVLVQFDKAIELFKKYYQYEEVNGSKRALHELVPEEAYREAVASALVHRQWDTSAYIRISMFEDRIEIVSPGGLPHGISEQEYLDGQVSILRNPILGNLFFRLGLIERFGTGVLRIRESYRNSTAKPQFDIYDNSIRICLPVLQAINDLSNESQIVYQTLKGKMLPISEIAEQTGFSKAKARRILSNLADRGYVTIVGKGRGTMYTASR